MTSLANVLTEAKDPSAFVVMMALFFFMGWFIGFIFRRIPFFRWLMLGAFAVTVIQHPHLPIAWEFPDFYIFWGCIGAYAMHWRKKAYEGGFSVSLPRTSGHFIARISGWFTSLIKAPFLALWWLLKKVVDLPIRLSVYLMRAGFRTKRFLTNLCSKKGRGILLTGFREWLWYLLPWELRAEWERQKSGVKSQTPFGDAAPTETARRYHKEKARAERKKDWETRSTFNKINKEFRRVFRKTGKDPAEAFTQGSSNHREQHSSDSRTESSEPPPNQQSQSSSQSSSSASDDFWNQTREKTTQEKQRRQQTDSRSRHSSSQSSSSQNEKRTDSNRTQSSSSQSSQQTEKNRRKDSGSASQGKTESKSANKEDKLDPSRAQDSPLTDDEKELLSKSYFDRHRALFDKAKWDFDPWECTLDPRGNKYATLKVSPHDDKPQIKKSYFKLSKKYRTFTSDAYPGEVRKRADLIGRILSGAHTRIMQNKP